MNPFDLSASELLIWGLVLHLIADWALQNDWMANNKMKRAHLGDIPGDGVFHAPGKMHPYTLWFIRHPAAYVHSGIHGVLLALIFGWVAIPLALAHLIIDCRWVVAWWSQLIKQTQPRGGEVVVHEEGVGWEDLPYYSIGLEVRFWTDQVFHIACIALAAVLVTM